MQIADDEYQNLRRINPSFPIPSIDFHGLLFSPRVAKLLDKRNGK